MRISDHCRERCYEHGISENRIEKIRQGPSKLKIGELLENRGNGVKLFLIHKDNTAITIVYRHNRINDAKHLNVDLVIGE